MIILGSLEKVLPASRNYSPAPLFDGVNTIVSEMDSSLNYDDLENRLYTSGERKICNRAF